MPNFVLFGIVRPSTSGVCHGKYDGSGSRVIGHFALPEITVVNDDGSTVSLIFAPVTSDAGVRSVEQ